MTTAPPFERQCPSCHGYGGETERILDDGTGPFQECGFCQGTGVITDRHHFYVTLGYVSVEVRDRKKRRGY